MTDHRDIDHYGKPYVWEVDSRSYEIDGREYDGDEAICPFFLKGGVGVGIRGATANTTALCGSKLKAWLRPGLNVRLRGCCG